MRAGPLDRLITIERFTETRDEFNAQVKNWGTLATVWASKSDVSDAERIAAQEAGSTITTRFQIRWSGDVSDVNARDRIAFDGKIYDVSGVKEIGRREGLELTTTLRQDLTT